MIKKLGIGFAFLLALAAPVFGQQGAWPNYPIVGGAAYCTSTTNGVCTNTVPAGPTAIVGSEQFPANTGLSSGRTPQNVLVTPAALNALPITWVTVLHAPPDNISASNIQGGVFYIGTETITSANLSLPLNAIEGQRFALSANRNITTLAIFAPAGDTLGAEASPTVLSTNTVGGPMGYMWRYHASTKVWHRFQ